MPRFFEPVTGDTVQLSGETAAHITKSLRMQPGEQLTVCDNGFDYICEILSTGDPVCCRVLSSAPNASEPDLSVTLYQCIPKGDKLELVIQKAVELGVSEIVPVLSERCVSRPDSRASGKKNIRYNKIALEACKQSGRGRVVRVQPMLSFSDAVKQIADYELKLFFYEGGGTPLSKVIHPAHSCCLFIGPEGGFSPGEVQTAQNAGAIPVTLGRRILRTETAPLAALCGVMLLTGNLE